jgi:hypothetical protein
VSRREEEATRGGREERKQSKRETIKIGKSEGLFGWRRLLWKTEVDWGRIGLGSNRLKNLIGFSALATIRS